MDPAKIKAIADWNPPTNVKSVRTFSGFANYYRLFIKDFAMLSRPLTNLAKKDIKFEWTSKCEEAFQQIKKKFIEEPILAKFNPELETQLEPDSSGWAVGGTLSQRDSISGLWRPVAFFSTKHLPAEFDYDIHDKELLAVIKCVKEWNRELRGLRKPFTILTDHKNVEPFATKKKLTERQIRWMKILTPLNFTVKHRPGKASVVPDALSCREQDLPQNETDTRLTMREQILLPASLWVNKMQVADLRCPFLDDSNLKSLWEEAMKSSAVSEVYLRAYQVIQNHERMFPSELTLRVST